MDREELITKLQNFRQVCVDSGYIEDFPFYLDEAYPGIRATSYVVKMVVKKQWRDTMDSTGKALFRLLEVLFETTEAKIRESVFTLAIHNEDERNLMKLPSYRAVA